MPVLNMSCWAPLPERANNDVATVFAPVYRFTSLQQRRPVQQSVPSRAVHAVKSSPSFSEQSLSAW